MGHSRLGINAEVQVNHHRSMRERKPLGSSGRERGEGWGTNYDHSFPLSQLKITTQVAFCLICNRKQERGRLMWQTPPRRAALPSRLPLTGTPDLPGFSPTHGISRINKLMCALFMFTCIKSKIKELKCKFSN